MKARHLAIGLALLAAGCGPASTENGKPGGDPSAAPTKTKLTAGEGEILVQYHVPGMS